MPLPLRESTTVAPISVSPLLVSLTVPLMVYFCPAAVNGSSNSRTMIILFIVLFAIILIYIFSISSFTVRPSTGWR